MSMNINIRNQKGLSIIELMIAMTLGLILTAGAIQIFVSTKTTNKVENALSRLQETGRYIIDAMAKDIRMAGYNGCASRGTMEVNIVAEDPPPYATTGDVFSGEDALRGYQYDSGAWTPTGTADLNLASPSPLTSADIVHIQLGSSCGAYVSEETDNSGATGNEHVTYPNTCDFQQDEAVLITDCTNADLFQITNVVNPGGSSGKQTLAHGSGNNISPKLGTVYDTDSEIFKFSTVTYYIGNNDEGEPALYKSKWNPEGTAGMTAADFDDPLELADGVEDMEILYGEDTGGGDDYADQYVEAKDVSDWTEVRSVRINLLLRSDEGITSKPQTLTFNGNSVGGADSRLRMIYTSTVTLRNRLP